MNIALLQRDHVRWLTAAPLWDRASGVSGAGSRMGEPAILRFEGDTFMQQAQQTLAEDPGGMARFVARPESWRDASAGWLDTPDSAPVTLYQPIHNRFYLATATLVCQRPGLPDRSLNRVGGDQVSMLLRRLNPRSTAPVNPANPASYVEQAWIGTAQTGRWITLDSPDLPATGEERLPMFPLPYHEDGRARCLHGAVIPVARANGYDTPQAEAESRASISDSVADPLGDPRKAELREGILAGFAKLMELEGGPPIPGDIIADVRIQTRSALVFAMLDMALFLHRELPQILSVIRGAPLWTLSAPQQLLFQRFNTTTLTSGYTAAQMLVRAQDREDQLQTGTPSAGVLSAVLGTNPDLDDIGSFARRLTTLGGDIDGLFFPLAPAAQPLPDPRTAILRDATAQSSTRITTEAEFGGDEGAQTAMLRALLDFDALLARELPDVAAALPDGALPASADAAIFAAFDNTLAGSVTWGAALVHARAHAADLVAGTPPRRLLALTANQITAAAPGFFAGIADAITPSVEARPLPINPPAAITADTDTPLPVYVLRTAYERPACAGIHPPVVSAPSRAFHLASFYDADAPVRPLKIEMPARTSIADLRRAPKNVSIQLSKELRKQMSRVRNAQLSDPLDEQLGGGGGFDFGVICSLSIPIITICALLLLMIIVQLLNIVFWWLPFFMICFPVKK